MLNKQAHHYMKWRCPIGALIGHTTARSAGVSNTFQSQYKIRFLALSLNIVATNMLV